MFTWMAEQFLNRCYLAGPGTHKRIIGEMAATLRNLAWSIFLAGVLIGGIGGVILNAVATGS